MGALTETRKRLNDFFSLGCAFSPNYPAEVPPAKKPRISSETPVIEKPLSAESTPKRISKLRSLPPPGPLPRTVHAPQRNRKFFGSVNSVRKSEGGDRMGNCQSTVDSLFQRKEVREEASGSLRNSGSVVNVVDVDANRSRDVITEGLTIEEYKKLVEAREVNLVHSDWRSGDLHLQEQKTPDPPFVSSSSPVSDLTIVTPKFDNVESVGKMIEYVSVNRAGKTTPVYKELYESVKQRRDPKLSLLDFELRLTLLKRSAFDRVKEEKKDVAYEPFVPLTDEEEDHISDALSGFDGQELLVTHESSNIEITREVLQCLRPGGWLNDEVVNVYLELLKERERRNPGKFLKCHFFNTFFYKKLVSGRSGYDYKAVRRWTTQKKIGYGLIECDKIFVPIHKDIHWCLAIINIKDEKLQYLDSLGGMDFQVLKALARYFVDEVKDKSNRDVDVSSWKQEFVGELPEQENGWDCGMFMIKYVDFYSRGLTLCFNQEHMPYFRKRTVMEILRLKAE
ncbi:Peptidase C48 [Cinnamomum micranthum f. kanehirae]|uniref:Peptidase C48 n=1 Tax=Cinnamomum micranthum f. kanehirae TaxID=337451 RepID=A0A443PTV5_9MAGN|nr:Peptidase C48 [Cinnamomum micranthum f. kanehirae]